MRLFFGGAEIAGWAELLAQANVPDISLSFVGLSRRKSGNWLLTEHYPDNQNMFIDSGAYTFNKPGSTSTREEAELLAEAYMKFVASNLDRAEMVSEFDAQILGRDYIERLRGEFWDDIGDKFMPIWHADYGMEELERLASTYKRVGIIQTDVDGRDIAPVLNGLVSRYGVLLHGVALTHMGLMRSIKWDSVGSTSWLSPSQFGDTFVWTGRELKRYPMKYKEQARKRHRVLFDREGFDAQKIADDDRTEVLKLSVWSWMQLINDINRHGSVVTQGPEKWFEENEQTDPGAVDTLAFGNRNDELLPPRELKLLPIMGFTFGTATEEDENGEQTTREVPLFEPRSSSLRMCDSCFLKGKCPGFEPHRNCAYDIPIVVHTPEQLRALYDGLVAMQAQRVLFMQMAEQIEGGYADPNLSSEMDRLQRLIKQKQESEREGFTLKVEASEVGRTGYFSKMFGNEAGQKLNPPGPAMQADHIIQGTRIIDE
jgi:hypothetical protein